MNKINIQKETLPNKKKGPIRFEAIIPVTALSLLTFFYFSYYFDFHMKRMFEYVGTQINGAEVNIESIRTSFIRGSFDMNRLQVTNLEKPTHNSIEIGNMHFQYLWDALLRMKFVVEDASINNIQMMKPRLKVGHVLPPRPASPSKMEEIQNEVLSQIKNKYSANMLGDVLSVLEGGDYEGQFQKIRETLKSESRVKEMASDVTAKKEFWDSKLKKLSDTSKVKEIEATINEVKNQKNFIQQAQGIKKLTSLLSDVDKQYKEIEKSSKLLQSEVKTLSQYPAELQTLVNEDISALKNRFSVPQLDFKDMAMHLFANEFAEYISKVRKYQAVAEQYLPEKKKEEELIIPRNRSEGKSYHFPITTGYPLFWLKRAAISSKGTSESYSGQVSGDLTNVTTSPQLIGKPVVLDVRGDFPGVKISGLKAVIVADFTRNIGRQSALIQINSFQVPEKIFINNEKLKFGFMNAVGSSTITATLEDKSFQMNWNSTLHKPKFLVDTSNKIAKEILTNVVNNIPVIHINGKASGLFTHFGMSIDSNLGNELQEGFTREIGAKLTEAKNKIDHFVDEKISGPKNTLMMALGGNATNLSSLGNLQELYKKNEKQIKAEIEKLRKGDSVDELKKKGKDLLKRFKL
jgi:uncharacterized protein (TIGR03545 family)